MHVDDVFVSLHLHKTIVNNDIRLQLIVFVLFDLSVSEGLKVVGKKGYKR